jgi:hypothetical protein
MSRGLLSCSKKWRKEEFKYFPPIVSFYNRAINYILWIKNMTFLLNFQSHFYTPCSM